MINFILSTHFNKVINNRKSVFLKKWAVKTNGMKTKSKTCDNDHYKLKLVTQRVSDTKKEDSGISIAHLRGHRCFVESAKYALPDSFYILLL